MLIEFLLAFGLFSLTLGATLGLVGLWVFWKDRKNGALILGLILLALGVGILVIADRVSSHL